MKTIDGDLVALALAGDFDVIVHGCNCFTTMGSGIAKQIRAVFPTAYNADCETKTGDRDKLGSCSVAEINVNDRALIVVNAYTQFRYGAGQVHADYDAIRSCFKWIRLQYASKRIGFPRIGAGLAGGDWSVISEIIEQELDGMDATLVNYKG